MAPEPGRTMIRMPTKPATTPSQSWTEVRSPRIGAERATTSSGEAKVRAVTSASGRRARPATTAKLASTGIRPRPICSQGEATRRSVGHSARRVVARITGTAKA